MESGEGQSPQEIMLLPEEERKMLGRQNPHAFLYSLFQLRKLRRSNDPPKALWLLYEEPRFVLSKDQLPLYYVVSRKYIMVL